MLLSITIKIILYIVKNNNILELYFQYNSETN